MALVRTPRIMISGVCAGAGKSFIMLCLLHELRRRGVGVSCGVVGPNITQAILLKRLSGRFVRTFDDRLLSSAQNLQALGQASIGADLVVIEGKEGLYDGYGAGTTRGADSEIAALTKTPVVLVADTRGFGSSIVALLRGYAAKAKDFALCGTILNRVQQGDFADVRDRDYFAATLEAFGLRGVLLGAMPELAGGEILARGFLSQQRNQTVLPRQFLIEAGALAAQHLDIDQIIERAATAPEIDVPDETAGILSRRVRIAVSDDSCFGLCFQDNLDLLRHYGAEAVPFSPIADTGLPKRIGGVYLTGAALAEYAKELSSNTSMRQAISDFVKGGGVLYSEGAGSAYLAQEYMVLGSNEVFKGVGVLPGRAVVAPFCLRYCEAVTMDDSVFGTPGFIVKCIFTDEWRLENEPKMVRALRFSGGSRGGFMEGYSPGAQVLSTFGFAQFSSNPEIAKNLVDAAQVVQSLVDQTAAG